MISHRNLSVYRGKVKSMNEYTDKKIKICNMIIALSGAVLAVLVKTIAAPCSSTVACVGGSELYMCCHYTGKAAFLMGVLICAMGVEHFFRGNKGVFQYLVMMVILILLPIRSAGIGVCQAEGMACSATRMCIWIIAGLIGCAAILQFLIKGENDI